MIAPEMKTIQTGRMFETDPQVLSILKSNGILNMADVIEYKPIELHHVLCHHIKAWLQIVNTARSYGWYVHDDESWTSNAGDATPLQKIEVTDPYLNLGDVASLLINVNIFTLYDLIQFPPIAIKNTWEIGVKRYKRILDALGMLGYKPNETMIEWERKIPLFRRISQEELKQHADEYAFMCRSGCISEAC